MSENTNNKKRNPNFSQNEKSLLLHCAFAEKDIIENKKTDGATWKEKENAWQRIEKMFNTQSGACFRNSESLKRFYNNYKADIRKEAAKEKSSSLQTGGGKPFTPSDPNFELAVSIMNPKTVYGLQNEFDGDKSVEQQESDKCDEDSNDWSSYKPSMLKNKINPKLKKQTQSEKTFFADEKSSEIPKERSPQVVMTKGFKKQFDNMDENKTAWTSRRRPVASTLPSSKITEQYSELSKIKIELAKLQFETFKEEAIQKKYQNNIEHDLKRKSLELDIEIKSEVLKKLKEKECTTKDPHTMFKDIDMFFKQLN